MIFIINLIILIFCLYIVAVQIQQYNNIISDKYRFRYFALRDRLALLVANNEIQEDSWEYQKIIDTINFHISAVETMSIEKLMSVLIEFHTSQEEARRIKLYEKNIDNEAVLHILADFMEVTSSLLRRNSKMQIWAINIFCNLHDQKQSTKSIPEIEKMKGRTIALENIDSFKDSLNSRIIPQAFA